MDHRLWEVFFVKSFFDKLIGQVRGAKLTAEVPTKPVTPEQAATLKTVTIGHLEPPQLIAACAQSVGQQRDHNEDALFTLTTTLSSNHTNLPFGLYVVADGMGGHQHGEVASGIAVRSLVNHVIRKLFIPLMSIKPSSPDQSLQEIMQEGIQEAHRSILKQVPGGGTTLTAALVLGEQMTIAHVGDSRAYLFDREWHIDVITRDHSLVKRLVELGQITDEEAAMHPQRNVLYRALGQGEPFEADINTMRLPPAGHLMLCSDGLWGVIAEDKIISLIKTSPNVESACQELVNAANEAGGPDNISAVLVRLPD
jgi:serine/threonine protein phosphatase PrpC